MTDERPAWAARLRVRSSSAPLAGWLRAALEPEASREVPRTRARVEASDPSTVEVRVEARDLGALRAALNTYLGWVDLAERTAHSAGRELPSGAPES